jgi:hypothetical protein
VFAFHDHDKLSPRMLARLAKHTGLQLDDLWREPVNRTPAWVAVILKTHRPVKKFHFQPELGELTGTG